jgi:hypothetical protein
MARRANYGFEKRQREIKKQKKKQEKAERKRAAAAEDAEPKLDDAPDEGAAGLEPPDRD